MSEDDDIKVANGTLRNIHSATQCAANPGGCWIHSPRSHPLAAAPVHWREDKQTAERLCPHGIGHPDTQDAIYWWAGHRRDVTVHACDGCCTPVPRWAQELLPPPVTRHECPPHHRGGS